MQCLCSPPLLSFERATSSSETYNRICFCTKGYILTNCTNHIDKQRVSTPQSDISESLSIAQSMHHSGIHLRGPAQGTDQSSGLRTHWASRTWDRNTQLAPICPSNDTNPLCSTYLTVLSNATPMLGVSPFGRKLPRPHRAAGSVFACKRSNFPSPFMLLLIRSNICKHNIVIIPTR